MRRLPPAGLRQNSREGVREWEEPARHANARERNLDGLAKCTIHDGVAKILFSLKESSAITDPELLGRLRRLDIACQRIDLVGTGTRRLFRKEGGL